MENEEEKNYILQIYINKKLFRFCKVTFFTLFIIILLISLLVGISYLTGPRPFEPRSSALSSVIRLTSEGMSKRCHSFSVGFIEFFEKFNIMKLNEKEDFRKKLYERCRWGYDEDSVLPSMPKFIDIIDIIYMIIHMENTIYVGVNEELIYNQDSFKQLVEILKKPCYYLPPKQDLEIEFAKYKDLTSRGFEAQYINGMLEDRASLKCDIKKDKREKIRVNVFPNKKEPGVYRKRLFTIEVGRED